MGPLKIFGSRIAIAIVPAVFLFLAFSVPIEPRGVRFLSFNSYTYLFNGYLLTLGEKFPFFEHPGFPLIYLNAALIKSYEFFYFTEPISISVFLDNFEYFYIFCVQVLWALVAISLYFFGWFTLKKYPLPIVIPAQFLFIGSVNSVSGLSALTPELLLPFFGVLNALVVLKIFSLSWLPPILASMVILRLNFLPTLAEIFLFRGVKRQIYAFSFTVFCMAIYAVRFGGDFSSIEFIFERAMSVVQGGSETEADVYRSRLWNDIIWNLGIFYFFFLILVVFTWSPARKYFLKERRLVICSAVILLTLFQFYLRPVHVRYLYSILFLMPILLLDLWSALRPPLYKSLLLLMTYFFIGVSLVLFWQKNREDALWSLKQRQQSKREAGILDSNSECLFLSSGGSGRRLMDLFLVNSVLENRFSKDLYRKYPNAFFSDFGIFYDFAGNKLDAVFLEGKKVRCALIHGAGSLAHLSNDFKSIFPTYRWTRLAEDIFIGKN